jgi:outer membrane immunogenic protein
MKTFAAKLLSFAATGAASLSMATCASAQNWSGFYAGVNVGGSRSMTDFSSSLPCAPNCVYFTPGGSNALNRKGTGSANSSAFAGGVQAGYNVQSAAFVFGIEADINSIRIDANRGVHHVYPGTAEGIDVDDKIQMSYLATLRPRIGYVSGEWLFYATGGLAITNLKHSFSNNEFGRGTGCSAVFGINHCGSGTSSSHYGWTIGGGVEWAFAKNWSLKGEYLYTDFGSTSGNSGIATPVGSPVFSHAGDLSLQTLRTGINYKF